MKLHLTVLDQTQTLQQDRGNRSPRARSTELSPDHYFKGHVVEAPSYQSIKDYRYSSEELRYVQCNRQRMIIGTPDIVEQKITALADNFQVDEIVIATFANTFEDRIRSYELLAERFKLKSNVSAIADTEGPTS